MLWLLISSDSTRRKYMLWLLIRSAYTHGRYMMWLHILSIFTRGKQLLWLLIRSAWIRGKHTLYVLITHYNASTQGKHNVNYTLQVPALEEYISCASTSTRGKRILWLLIRSAFTRGKHVVTPHQKCLEKNICCDYTLEVPRIEENILWLHLRSASSRVKHMLWLHIRSASLLVENICCDYTLEVPLLPQKYVVITH